MSKKKAKVPKQAKAKAPEGQCPPTDAKPINQHKQLAGY